MDMDVARAEEVIELSRLHYWRKVYGQDREGHQTIANMGVKNNMKPITDPAEEQLIRDYFERSNTHVCRDVSIVDMWSVYRPEEEKLFRQMGYHQKETMLLWLKNVSHHCSQFILMSGLKAKLFGRFGTGFYFADRVSKAMSPAFEDDYLYLCEVATGERFKTRVPCKYEQPPDGSDSVQGVGTWEPDPNQRVFIDNCLVPYGLTVENPWAGNTPIRFNEYCIFSADRALIKYLVVVRDKHTYD